MSEPNMTIECPKDECSGQFTFFIGPWNDTCGVDKQTCQHKLSYQEITNLAGKLYAREHLETEDAPSVMATLVGVDAGTDDAVETLDRLIDEARKLK